MRGSAMVFAIAAGLAAPGTVYAGDVAAVEVLGFSADGAVFAFEEYGIQDGSGFPYSNRFYIDTASDSYLPGTPIRVRIDDEAADLSAARADAAAQGDAIVANDELAGNRGFTAGWNAVTEYSADPHRMSVTPRPVFAPIDPPLEFRLEEFDTAVPERCRELGDIKGFRLLRVALTPGATTSVVHEDETVPQSRGCPLGYRIGGIQTFHPQGGTPVFAVLVSIRQVGFEGPDYRWMAIAGHLE